MTNDKLLSQSINFLRFPLIIGILYVHFYLAKTGLSIHGVKYGADAPVGNAQFDQEFLELR